MKYKPDNIIREIPMVWGFDGDHKGTKLGTAYLTKDLMLLVPPFKLPETAASTSAFYPVMKIDWLKVPKDNPARITLGQCFAAGTVTNLPVSIDTATGSIDFKGNTVCAAGRTITFGSINLAQVFLEEM